MALLWSLCTSWGMCCAAAFALLPLSQQLLPPVQLGNSSVSSVLTLYHSHLQTSERKSQMKSEKSLLTHTGSLEHELITHLSSGLHPQIPLVSLGRAVDRIAVFLKAKSGQRNRIPSAVRDELCMCIHALFFN